MNGYDSASLAARGLAEKDYRRKAKEAASGDPPDFPRDRIERRQQRGQQAESALNPQIPPRPPWPTLTEAPLTAERRNSLPDADFAGPNRTYPIDTPERARAALARASVNAPDLLPRIRRAIRRKYPDMEVRDPSE